MKRPKRHANKGMATERSLYTTISRPTQFCETGYYTKQITWKFEIDPFSQRSIYILMQKAVTIHTVYFESS